MFMHGCVTHLCNCIVRSRLALTFVIAMLPPLLPLVVIVGANLRISVDYSGPLPLLTYHAPLVHQWCTVDMCVIYMYIMYIVEYWNEHHARWMGCGFHTHNAHLAHTRMRTFHRQTDGCVRFRVRHALPTPR